MLWGAATLALIVSNRTTFFVGIFFSQFSAAGTLSERRGTYRLLANFIPLSPPGFRNEVLEGHHALVTLPWVVRQVSVQSGKS